MALRNLSLTERREGNRNQNRVPTHFSIEQIKEHFVESMESIKNNLKLRIDYFLKKMKRVVI